MKKLSVFLMSFFSTTWMHAADPEGFVLWTNAAVKNSGKELANKLDDQKFAWQPLGTYENHYMGISHREGDGNAEVHETQDIWIFESGEATLILGGTMVGPKAIKPHEIRGTSIKGGTTQQLFAGDIVHIPVNVPHQLKITSGKTFTYLVVKVDSR